MYVSFMNFVLIWVILNIIQYFVHLIPGLWLVPFQGLHQNGIALIFYPDRNKL